MNPVKLIRMTAQSFREAGIPDAEYDAALILSHLTGVHPLKLRLDTETVLDQSIITAYQNLSDKRLMRIPLQYLLGEVSFFGRTFQVDNRVLIPRPETELLCEWAIEILQSFQKPRVLDLCCGSGCIGLTIKAERPEAVLSLSDISVEALAVASGNAKRLSLKCNLIRSDLFNSVPCRKFDLIISNPPYIPSETCRHLQPEVNFEPRNALDGGSDGLDLYRRIVADAKPFLPSGGMLLMELGADEADDVSVLLCEHHYISVQIRKDLAGIDRMILAVNP